MSGFDYLITFSFFFFFWGGGGGYVQAQGIVFDTSDSYSCCRMLNSPSFPYSMIKRKTYMYLLGFFVYFYVDIFVVTRVVSMPLAWAYNKA